MSSRGCAWVCVLRARAAWSSTPPHTSSRHPPRTSLHRHVCAWPYQKQMPHTTRGPDPTCHSTHTQPPFQRPGSRLQKNLAKPYLVRLAVLAYLYLSVRCLFQGRVLVPIALVEGDNGDAPKHAYTYTHTHITLHKHPTNNPLRDQWWLGEAPSPIRPRHMMEIGRI